MKKIFKLTSNLSKLQYITLILTKTMHWNFTNSWSIQIKWCYLSI